jgi:hypothetical protein
MHTHDLSGFDADFSTTLHDAPLELGRIEGGVCALEAHGDEQEALFLAVQIDNLAAFEFWVDMPLNDLLTNAHWQLSYRDKQGTATHVLATKGDGALWATE